MVPSLYLRILHITLEVSILHHWSQLAVLRVFAVAVYPQFNGRCSFGHRADNVAFHLPLSRHCDEGKQDGDDGLLVHCSICP